MKSRFSTVGLLLKVKKNMTKFFVGVRFDITSEFASEFN